MVLFIKKDGNSSLFDLKLDAKVDTMLSELRGVIGEIRHLVA